MNNKYEKNVFEDIDPILSLKKDKLNNRYFSCYTFSLKEPTQKLLAITRF